jgi:hypothetical protein
MNLKSYLKIFSIISFLSFNLYSQGKVYLVLGSDTAIWDGMDVSKYHCYYNLDLFTSASSNTSVVMSESFRDQLVDSYGNKLKMTWWMIGGNMFRYATNNNVPIGNTMALYLMKKYYGDKIDKWDDELSLHYHTFYWSDYDGDGKFWWNQAKSFADMKEDFDLTLAQFLLEENVYPISFRSGWHYMDNIWQNYLNKLLPYSLHNDWPAVHQDLEEPIDNDYDWSQASSEFIPFHPSPDNYQLPGNSKGWNVRSKYMGSTTQQFFNDIFSKANLGQDQLVCLWSHLPEENFINEIQQVNTLAHQAALNYPNVKFQYCSAIEGYQLWRKLADTTKPILILEPEVNGQSANFVIRTDEPIFQSQPFTVIKDRYARYHIEDCEYVAPNIWRTTNSFPFDELAKVGVAVSDTTGNLSTAFINYLPDDKFIDNKDSSYKEIFGSWSSSSTSAWGTDSRFTSLNMGDSAKVQWDLKAEYTGYYSFFTQFPAIQNQIDTVGFSITSNNQLLNKNIIINPSDYNKWIYINNLYLNKGENIIVEMSGKNDQNEPKVFAADVLKASAYVRERNLVPEKLEINYDEFSIEDTLNLNLKIDNLGIGSLTISDLYSTNNIIKSTNSIPLIIGPMNSAELELLFIPNKLGLTEDTILIYSDDPINQIQKIPISVNVVNYFEITDNDFAQQYFEYGNWYKSVVQAYGNSSRYAYIQNTPNGPNAKFTTQIKKNGIYDIYEIVPKTVNSANNALYIISQGNTIVDSTYLNQNEGSGNWKKIGRYQLNNGEPVTVRVVDSGESSSGPVIRADAIKIALIEELTNIDEKENSSVPTEFKLFQNFPNPFNNSTSIKYAIPKGGLVSIKLYNIIGEEVATIVNEIKSAGNYQTNFNAANLTSGIYFYKINAEGFSEAKKMILLK